MLPTPGITALRAFSLNNSHFFTDNEIQTLKKEGFLVQRVKESLKGPRK